LFGKRRKQDTARLQLWQGRYQRNKNAYANELNKMDRRDALYGGTKEIRGTEGAEKVKPANHVRNVVAELVESQVSSSVPQPKVTALRPQDERLAKLIEDMLRNELDRMPFEYLNDQQERTTYIQGGDGALVEWDSSKSTHFTLGELKVSDQHPKKIIPQDGVYSDLEDMDYWFLDLPQTKAYIHRKYGADVSDASETVPEAKGPEGSQDTAEDMVTQHVACYRNEAGGVGIFSWVCDTVLEDLEDYQARRIYTCAKCGEKGNGRECRYCRSKQFEESSEEYETLTEDIQTTDGRIIPAWSQVLDERGMPALEYVGPPLRPEEAAWAQAPAFSAENAHLWEPVMEPTRIPYYKPDLYPLVLRKNVSVNGRFLGSSDVDMIEDQQETTKKISTKINEKVFKGGSVLSAPEEAVLDLTDEELRILRIRDPAEKAMLGVYNLQPDISGDLAWRAEIYEEARQTIGITDSFQGRQDRTATSGVAKEFAARQSAGRLESKRTMKDAFYGRLFEVMFKFMLAYADEPRTIVSRDNQGHSKYQTWYRYDFLEQDEAGEWYWNDRFLFSVDASATLANNREALWQETRMNFQQGCFGAPASTQALLVFWTRMDDLHYPGAADNKTYFEEKWKQEQQAQAAVQAVAGAAPVPPERGGAGVMGAAAPAGKP